MSNFLVDFESNENMVVQSEEAYTINKTAPKIAEESSDEETENHQESIKLLTRSGHKSLENESKIPSPENNVEQKREKDLEANVDELVLTFNADDVIDELYYELSDEKHLRPQITFLDFAGQKTYYAFNQIYLSPKSSYILVVDMTKNFDEIVHEPGDEEIQENCSRFESWKYKGIA